MRSIENASSLIKQESSACGSDDYDNLILMDDHDQHDHQASSFYNGDIVDFGYKYEYDGDLGDYDDDDMIMPKYVHRNKGGRKQVHVLLIAVFVKFNSWKFSACSC